MANPGTYTGRYLAAGHAAPRANDAGKRITIAAGADIRKADIALPHAVAIEGRVTDESGEPLARISMFAARVMLGTSSPQRVSHPPALTDDLGRYRIYGLEPGAYIVGATGQLLLPVSETSADGMIHFARFNQWEPAAVHHDVPSFRPGRGLGAAGDAGDAGCDRCRHHAVAQPPVHVVRDGGRLAGGAGRNL